jgi:sulfotransferase family protein
MKLDTDISVVWIATNPRTGSMWTTNIAREVVRSLGIEPLSSPPQAITDNEHLRFGVMHIFSRATGVAVVKSHTPVPLLPRSVGIVSQRDVRDAMVSYMRFMRADFEAALDFARMTLNLPPEKLYRGSPRLVLNYETISEDPVGAVRLIAAFLEVPNVDCVAIAERYSKAAVRKRIEMLAQAAIGGRRALDAQTGFQTGHVSEDGDGKWREVFSPDQLERVNRVIGEFGRGVLV